MEGSIIDRDDTDRSTLVARRRQKALADAYLRLDPFGQAKFEREYLNSERQLEQYGVGSNVILQ